MSSLGAGFKKFRLNFITPMGTSRGVLHKRDTFIIALKSKPGGIGLGECAPLIGLSIDDRPDFFEKLAHVCEQLNAGRDPNNFDLKEWPSIKFGLESALLDLKNGGRRLFFDTEFTRGQKNIPINGLIVMGDIDDMFKQAMHKIETGFKCIKLKIGGIDFDAECHLLAEIRKTYPANEIEIRLDANGAFDQETALDQLNKLAEFDIHSIEQPIKPGQWEDTATICTQSPIPVALDEELIGINNLESKSNLLQNIKPQYLILKPTLVGGIEASMAWIGLAQKFGIGYWITSALESNIGLNVISQWTSSLGLISAQGLGTGRIFDSNFPSALRIEKGMLCFSDHNQPESVANLSELKLTEI